MIVDFQVRVRDEKIILDIPQKSIHREFKNLLGRANGRVVALGQSLEDLIRENPENEDKFRTEVKFEPLYTASAVGLEQLHLFLDFQKHQFHRAGIPFFTSKSINLELELPGYEGIDENARSPFEFLLTKLMARNLTINKKLKGWKNWQRQLLETSRFLFLLMWSFLWYWFVLAIASLMENPGFGRWIIYLAALFGIYYLLIFLRVAALKFILPHDLLKGELLGMGKYGKFLVKKLFESE